jgi:hypothetical protein
MTYKIPNQSNLYGTIFSVESKKTLAYMFGANGWRVRKSTWIDYEVHTDWGEIVIEDEEANPLIHGLIDPVMFDNFRQLLDSSNLKYSLELYDDEGNLIKEEKTRD